MAQDFVGTKRWVRPATPYELYMEEQKLPIHRGTVGFFDIRDLTLTAWKRMGAQGAFIELNGCGGLQGMYVIEVPGAGAIVPEKHMYEEIFYVLEGRGTTEVWNEGAGDKKQTFEWQQGSLFSPPLNTWHRIVNATSSPALLLGVTNAPPIFHLYRSQDALFNNPYQFKDRYDGSAEYFKAHTELGKDPRHGRARNYGNIIPDADHVELPLDGQRGVGHRTFFWNLSGNSFQGFIAQYAPGRYSRCHNHEAGQVIV
jgi:mannose-6-phosphate isomerase-like protein (cupin superfamily)